MKNKDLIKDFGWVGIKQNEQEYRAYSRISDMSQINNYGNKW